MKMKSVVLFFVLCLLLGSCSSTNQIIVPLTATANIEDTYTIIWNGTSKAFRYVEDEWVRDETYDYVFDVVQKRYEKTWKSVKNLHRLHPAYDGKAGLRSQSMYFELAYELAGESLRSQISSSLGNGTGTSDRVFREQELNFALTNLSSFAPYSHMRIRQTYDYEEGVLTELVELFKVKDGQEIPFMKNEETAYFYIKGQLDAPPTTL
ncbi:MAG: hypothetical protein ACRBFS_03720 [Aureispira sp.]